MNRSLHITLEKTLEFIPLNKDEKVLRSESEYKLMHDQLNDLHKSFSLLNMIVEKQEEDLESIHESIEETIRNVKESQQELVICEESKFSQRFTNISLSVMSGILCAAGLELVLPGNSLLYGGIVGGITSLLQLYK